MNDWLVPVLFGLAASGATLLGGVLALRQAARDAALLAISAGVVLGVAFFDLLPEAIAIGALAYPPRAIMVFAAGGLAGYLLLSRTLASLEGPSAWRGHLGPASLTLHSFLDGLIMGIAFQIAPDVGWLVALAVLTHDLADGLNTVSLALETSRRETALRWLAINGAAPLLGVVTGLVVALPAAALAPVMATFAGIFLYIGAVELVPRSLARDGRLRTTLQVLGGFALMLAITAVAD
ncbi:zinc transporter, ZIP family [Sphingomonas guangdongensis]|uniref:Zinc transporter, ZIP family n=1 Tax=Sphingomonas guangdongensis TaxID=1141890 RepID=A0A285R2J3_9SPHN|nr:ZIP family metal transporter [Sphingomonas guangdongensis]SOB88323.1 zinc transporter, ZIP family [Sphingomonas guangdongensis]